VTRLTPGKVSLRQLQSITSGLLGPHNPTGFGTQEECRKTLGIAVLVYQLDLICPGHSAPAPRSAPEAAMFSTVQFHYGRSYKSDPVSDFQSSYLGELLINLTESPLIS
jgi:hypothetical protein